MKIIDLLENYPASPTWLLIVGLILALLLFAFGLGLVAVVVAARGRWRLRVVRTVKADLAIADSILPQNEVDPAVVDSLSPDQTFAIEPFGVTTVVAATGTADTEEAKRFKEALRTSFQLHGDVERANPPVVRAPLDLDAVATATMVTIDPARSMPRRFAGSVRIPVRIIDGLRESFVEVMSTRGSTSRCTGRSPTSAASCSCRTSNLIPPNSITLLETNQRFIESLHGGTQPRVRP